MFTVQGWLYSDDDLWVVLSGYPMYSYWCWPLKGSDKLKHSNQAVFNL